MAQKRGPGRPKKDPKSITNAEVFKRKGKKCSVSGCGSTSNVIVEHKDGNRANNRPGNLRPVCQSCHQKMTPNKGRFGSGKPTQGKTGKKVATKGLQGGKMSSSANAKSKAAADSKRGTRTKSPLKKPGGNSSPGRKKK